MIASEASGLGDPWDLTPAQWDATILRVYEASALANGEENERSQVRIDRIKRQGRMTPKKETRHG